MKKLFLILLFSVYLIHNSFSQTEIKGKEEYCYVLYSEYLKSNKLVKELSIINPKGEIEKQILENDKIGYSETIKLINTMNAKNWTIVNMVTKSTNATGTTIGQDTMYLLRRNIE